MNHEYKFSFSYRRVLISTCSWNNDNQKAIPRFICKFFDINILKTAVKNYSTSLISHFHCISEKRAKQGGTVKEKGRTLRILDGLEEKDMNHEYEFSFFYRGVLISTCSWNNDNQDRDGSSCWKWMQGKEREGESFALHAELNDSPRQRLHDLPHVNTDEPLCSVYTGLVYRIFHSRINHS